MTETGDFAENTPTIAGTADGDEASYGAALTWCRGGGELSYGSKYDIYDAVFYWMFASGGARPTDVHDYMHDLQQINPNNNQTQLTIG